MASSQVSGVIQYLRRTVLLRDGAGLTDGQLLTDYISRHDEAALAALVRRHGPMVWGVCRRVLCNYHDAEDAFQATFLVLVRRAASIASRELFANWLYGVAHQTALKARSTAAKRKERERQVTEMPEPAIAEQDLWHDLQPLLDEELSRLPDKYRAVIVLCDLEGKTRKEAARQIGCPEGTVAGRLARARVMLAKRLAKRGVDLSGGALATVLSEKVASAGVPTSVVSSTIKAATLVAAGQAAAGVISVKVAALTEGVLKTMLLNKLKIASAVLLVVCIFGTGMGVSGFVCRTPAAEKVNPHAAVGLPFTVAALQDGQKGKKLPNCVQCHELKLRDNLPDSEKFWQQMRDLEMKVMAKSVTVHVAQREIEKALKRLREATNNDQETELEALDEIERAVKQMNEKAKKNPKRIRMPRFRFNEPAAKPEVFFFEWQPIKQAPKREPKETHQ